VHAYVEELAVYVIVPFVQTACSPLVQEIEHPLQVLFQSGLGTVTSPPRVYVGLHDVALSGVAVAPAWHVHVAG
jgi:hypothetical protein